jgi:hypothetical protein
VRDFVCENFMIQTLSASIVDKCNNLILRSGELMQVCVPDQVDIICFLVSSVRRFLFLGSMESPEISWSKTFWTSVRVRRMRAIFPDRINCAFCTHIDKESLVIT